jgi:hypothetical protein
MPDRSRKYPNRAYDPSRLVSQQALEKIIGPSRSPAQKAASAAWFRANMGPVEESIVEEADNAERRTARGGDTDVGPVYDEYGQY